jgi:hypothetical protein
MSFFSSFKLRLNSAYERIQSSLKMCHFSAQKPPMTDLFLGVKVNSSLKQNKIPFRILFDCIYLLPFLMPSFDASAIKALCYFLEYAQRRNFVVLI